MGFVIFYQRGDEKYLFIDGAGSYRRVGGIGKKPLIL
jgi:hypothetical protein